MADVTLCLLAGGEGRRMGGRDKGLVAHQGQALGLSVMQHMGPQVAHAIVVANRHADAYSDLWHQASAADPRMPAQAMVCPDDSDLPPWSGPLAGMITALRRSTTPWVQFVPCDAPQLPHNLVATLRQAAASNHDPDVVVPTTLDPDGQPRHHWVTCLVHRRTTLTLVAQFVAGERKVGRWAQALNWCSVPFKTANAFTNINALESEDVPR